MPSLAGTCDRHPSAQAHWIAQNGHLELTFCHHCMTKNALALTQQGFLVVEDAELTRPEGKPFIGPK